VVVVVASGEHRQRQWQRLFSARHTNQQTPGMNRLGGWEQTTAMGDETTDAGGDGHNNDDCGMTTSKQQST